MPLDEIESLSKTTKLLLLDSLLQEVCIESGSDGSLSLSSLGMSVCLVSHNLLYSGLKKAHSKKKSLARKVASCWLDACSMVIYELEKKDNILLSPHQRIWMSTWPSCLVDWLQLSQSVSQSDWHKRQNYAKCLQQPVFPGGHPSKY